MRRDGNDPEYCRTKAHDLVRAALGTAMGNERALLERSAAAWSMRADQLQRGKARLAIPADAHERSLSPEQAEATVLRERKERGPE